MQTTVPQHPSAAPLQLQCWAWALSKPQGWAKPGLSEISQMQKFTGENYSCTEPLLCAS